MLGVCCHWIEKRVKPRSGAEEIVNLMDEKTLQLGRYKDGKYTDELIGGIYRHNIQNLAAMLPIIRSNGIRLFRISSALFPLADQVDRSLWDNDEIRATLKRAGDFIKSAGMRVSTHPGQYTVLSSDSDRVVDNAVTELSMHAWFFDQMGLDESPFYAINIHGGKADRASQLIERIESLPSNIRSRLTLENDENCYSLADLLQVHERTGTSLVFDSHHHVFNEGGLSMSDAHNLACATWSRGIKPLQHISNTSPDVIDGSFTERRKHSDMIHYVPEPQLAALRDDTIDVDVEAKHKNLSVFQMSKDFQIPL
jgi:UV DNA damage endonuclease